MHPTIRQFVDSAAGHWFDWTNHGQRNRHRFYHDACGLRILNFHETPDRCFERFAKIVRRALDKYKPATPDDVDALMDGQLPHLNSDRVLFTFDDGYESNYRAARWLAEKGVRAIFFVVPSFLDRSPNRYLAYHRTNGISAYNFTHRCNTKSPRGLTSSQVKEMHAMGHRIGGHNYAHRNLGRLRNQADLDYEIGRTVGELGDLLATPCEDFAFAFGFNQHLSAEAAQYLANKCKRVYSAVRGLNVSSDAPPGMLLRITIQPERSMVLSMTAMEGALDHRSHSQRASLRDRFPCRKQAATNRRRTVLASGC
jgi:peptidoglycan/xylan/chitin deacetylase (PgdA/CDA1 family)